MSQWWMLFLLGIGVGVALQIAFPIWSLGANLDVPQANRVISRLWNAGVSLLKATILGVVVLVILVWGSL